MQRWRAHLAHVVGRAEDDGDALVDVLRDEVHDPRLAGEREAARLLDEVRHRRRLVQQPQLAVRVLRVGGVAEDAAVEQRAVDVADHRANVPRAVPLAALAEPLLDVFHVAPQRRVPVHAVGLVERVDAAAARQLDVGVREDELAD